MKHTSKSLLVSSTLVSLICGLALTQQQVKADTINPAGAKNFITTTANIKSKSGLENSNTKLSDFQNTPSTVSVKNDEAEKAENKNNKNTDENNPSQKSDTNPELIDEGTWGTSKWEYKHEGENYHLYLHAGTLGAEHIAGLNKDMSSNLTQITVDPGTRANQNSSGLFSGLENLNSISGLENLDTSNVTDMSGMFEDCCQLTNLDLSHFNTENVTDMSGMFMSCYNLSKVNLSSFNTKNVIYMFGMFSYNLKLKELDLSNFETPNLRDIDSMFNHCISLTSLDISRLIIKQDTVVHAFDSDNSLNHLVLGPNTFFSFYFNSVPPVPAVGTKIPGTNNVVAEPYWIATSGYRKGNKYISDELFQMKDRDQVTVYDWVAKPIYSETTESKAVIRFIVLHQPNKQDETETQTVVIKRKIKIAADGSKTYGEWTPEEWSEYKLPEIKGYLPNVSIVPAEAVDGNTINKTVDVYYEPVEQTITIQYMDQDKIVGTQTVKGYTGHTIKPDLQAPLGYELASTTQPTFTVDASGKQIVQVAVIHKIAQSIDSKTFTRTINIHQPDGTEKSFVQVALIRRTSYLDEITGEKSYGSWHNDSWDEFNVPEIAGYTPSQEIVPEKVVNCDSNNEQIDIYYLPNK